MIGAVGSQLADEAIDNAVSGLEMFDYINETVKLRYTDGTEVRFAEMIYRTVVADGEMPDEFEAALEDVLNSYSNKTALTVRRFVSKKIRGMVLDIKQRTANTKITADDISHLVALLRDELSGEFGEGASRSETDTASAELNKYSFGVFTVESFKTGNETLFELLSAVTADIAFYVTVAICIVLIGFILAVNVSKVGRGILTCGISLMAAGGLSAVGVALFDGLILNGEILDSEILRGLIDAFSDVAVDRLIVFGIVVAAVGFLASAIGVAVLAVSKKRKNTKRINCGGDRR